ncbi:MAG: GspB domain-containing protein, partial [Woeseiaceae bacterium]|nr:GspB domain-containing protein [Woeseiaceae bacterium]
LVLPDLHLDIHVYSDQPAERFVFVNMNKYREQARLAEGPLVKEITPEGVILEHLGNGFLLPRE